MERYKSSPLDAENLYDDGPTIESPQFPYQQPVQFHQAQSMPEWHRGTDCVDDDRKTRENQAQNSCEQ